MRRSIVKLIHRWNTMNKTIQRHMWSCHVHHGFTKVRDLAHVEVWEKSRTTCCRFLLSFAVPDKIVRLQRSWGKQAERNVTNDLHVSIVLRLHENVPSLGTAHHLSGPDMFALTRCAVYVRCVGVCSVFVVCYWCFVSVFGCVCWCASLCVVVVSHTLKITVT